MRIYPDLFPSYWMEPTQKDFEVNRVSGMGFGLFSKSDFKKGQQLFVFTGTVSTKVTQHSLQLSVGIHIHDPWVMGYSLHSCKPNCTVDMKERTFTALRDIGAGEAITMDYNETEDLLYKSFPCSCGSCSGKVVGGDAFNAEPIDQKIHRLLTENNWRFAKTLSHIPHYYTRGAEWDNRDDFDWCCEHIQNNFEVGSFSGTGNYKYKYFHMGKWMYWVMERDKPSNQQILINRALSKKSSQR